MEIKKNGSNFNKPYDSKEVENRIYKFWEEAGYFNPDNLPKPKTKNQKPKTFTIAIPPPNITGSLHMGHALNAALQDILVRKKRMEGYRTLWLPGIDHAGIATQNVVEKELRKQGISRHELGREKFLEKVWEWKEKYGHIILDQLKKLGCSLDWSRTRFTMDEKYQEAVRHAFIHYYNRGWIYRGERTVNWCSRCGTSLSDLEIEYKEEEVQMYYIKYGPLTIATVRPETKLGDTAVAVNPKDERYKKYIGKILDIETVLGPAKMKVIADPSVDMKFGTGAMKVTPAHDMHDFELSEKHGLERKQVIGSDGKMTALAGKYAGMKVPEARKAIVEDMKAKGILIKAEPYKHNVAVCYRCGMVLEPLLSKQWFVRMAEPPQNQKLGKSLCDLAIEAVKSGKVKFHPKRWEKIYFDWLTNIKDWCISRQIWWGHQIPVFFCKKTREFKIKDQRSKIKNIGNWDLGIGNSLGDNQFIVSVERPIKCPFCGECKMEQSLEVLDTWFSSALWPFAILGFPKETKDLKTFYPTQVLSTGRDIINLWIARMIFSGLEFMGKEPFKDVIIHPTILTREGERMSKSKGTGVDPLDLIEKYGADATRFGIIWQTMGTQDVRWSEEHVVAGKKFANKIWNAARFVLIQNGISNFSRHGGTPPSLSKDKNSAAGQFPISKPPRPKTMEDKKILTALQKTTEGVSKLIDKYEFGQALHILYDFFWHEFCDVYIEKSKLFLYARSQEGRQITNYQLQKNTKQILIYVLKESLKLLHPFMPFVTEEIYQHLPQLNKRPKSIMI